MAEYLKTTEAAQSNVLLHFRHLEKLGLLERKTITRKTVLFWVTDRERAITVANEEAKRPYLPTTSGRPKHSLPLREPGSVVVNSVWVWGHQTREVVKDRHATH